MLKKILKIFCHEEKPKKIVQMEQNLIRLKAPVTEKMRIFCVADTHYCVDADELRRFLQIYGMPDAVFFLGDIPGKDITIIQSVIKNIPQYGILGNHDCWGMLEKHNIENIHGRVLTLSGCRFLGWQGSLTYKNTDAPMMTDEESLDLAEKLPVADVLLSHDKGKAAGENNFHDGLSGINKYMEKNNVLYNIHGHYHINDMEKVGNSVVYGVYMYTYILLIPNRVLHS